MTIEIFDNPNKTYYITFINSNGEEFTIVPPNYILLDFDGFEQGQAEVQMSRAPYQDGKTLIDQLYPEKVITLQFAFLGKTQKEILDRRININNKFNSRLGIGILRFNQINGKSYQIDVITKSISFGNVTSTNYNNVIIELIAPNPFWYDPTQIERVLVGFSGGFSFPFSFPINFGIVGTTVTVINSGNVDTPVLILFDGEVENPEITNDTTEESIKIIKKIDDGDTLVINTIFGNKSVKILSGYTGTYSSAFEYVDPDSVFWQLVIGLNQITYTVTKEGVNAKGTLIYYNRYAGV